MDLPEFVTARLDDAEAALAALPADARGRWEASDNLIGTRQWVGLFAAPAKPGGPAPDLGRIADRAVAAHAARYGPAWVAADIAAKRALLAELADNVRHWGSGDHTRAAAEMALEAARRHLAAPHAGHPDYEPGWRIDG